MDVNQSVFSIDEAADICRVHHSRIREMLRHAATTVGHKDGWRLWLSAREIVALMVARELVAAGYTAGAALDAAHGVVWQYAERPRFDHRAAFPLAGAMGRSSVGPDALCGQVGTKIVIDLPANWALVETRCAELYELSAK